MIVRIRKEMMIGNQAIFFNNKRKFFLSQFFYQFQVCILFQIIIMEEGIEVINTAIKDIREMMNDIF